MCYSASHKINHKKKKVKNGITITPVVYDLARVTALTEAFPGKPLYVTDEYEKRTVKLNVSPEGYVSDLKLFAEKREFSSAIDANGNVYVADGDLYVFDSNGKKLKTIKTPERPSTIVVGGKDNKTLYMTGSTSVFSCSLNKDFVTSLSNMDDRQLRLPAGRFVGSR